MLRGDAMREFNGGKQPFIRVDKVKWTDKDIVKWMDEDN